MCTHNKCIKISLKKLMLLLSSSFHRVVGEYFACWFDYRITDMVFSTGILLVFSDVIRRKRIQNFSAKRGDNIQNLIK